jgi:hypothetical protein
MKTYFITVTSMEVAKKIDPNAELAKVLDPVPLYYTYCCSETKVYMMPERYVAKVQTALSRKQIKKIKGVVRLRAHLKENYRQYVVHQVC